MQTLAFSHVPPFSQSQGSEQSGPPKWRGHSHLYLFWGRGEQVPPLAHGSVVQIFTGIVQKSPVQPSGHTHVCGGVLWAILLGTQVPPFEHTTVEHTDVSVGKVEPHFWP